MLDVDYTIFTTSSLRCKIFISMLVIPDSVVSSCHFSVANSLSP